MTNSRTGQSTNSATRSSWVPLKHSNYATSFVRFSRTNFAALAAIHMRLRNYTAQRRVVCRKCATYLDTLAPVTANKVTRIIRHLPSKPAPSDCLPVSLLKAAVDVMAPLPAELANRSFAAGVFPSHYKTGRVVPLLKKACLDKDDPANYRPITSLRTFSKVLEKLSLARIQPHVSVFPSAYRTNTRRKLP